MLTFQVNKAASQAVCNNIFYYKYDVDFYPNNCEAIKYFSPASNEDECVEFCYSINGCTGIIIDSKLSTTKCCILRRNQTLHHRGNMILISRDDISQVCDVGFSGEVCDSCAVSEIWSGEFVYFNTYYGTRDISIELTYTGPDCKHFTGKYCTM